jgi:hypothetical protein
LPMAINKAHDEFHALDMSSGWETPAGYPAGIQQKILSGALDETNKRGSRTRLLRFAPGVYTTTPFAHEYWEEVFLFSGDLTVGNDVQGKGGEAFRPNTYACRPPGAFHGPFKSEGGCLDGNPLFRSRLIRKDRSPQRLIVGIAGASPAWYYGLPALKASRTCWQAGPDLAHQARCAAADPD